MSHLDILNAIEEENLGTVRRWLNSNTGRENINKILASNKTILNRALEIAANYKSRNTFAHRIVNILREHGAQTKKELENGPPTEINETINIFSEFNYQEPNIFHTPVAGEVSTTNIFSEKPPLAPLRPKNKPSRKLNGIAFGPRRNKQNSRKRRATRRN